MKYLNTEIRDMTEEDLDQVMEIENLCFKHPWKKVDFLYEMYENDFSNLLVIELSNQSLGLKQICGFIDFWTTFNSATIAQIAVHPDIQRQKLGTELINEAIKECKIKKVNTITLEVRVSNLTAQNFYLKHGFKKVVIKTGYYSDGEDAIYMMKEVEL